LKLFEDTAEENIYLGEFETDTEEEKQYQNISPYWHGDLRKIKARSNRSFLGQNVSRPVVLGNV
jgi:hypothetical protein